VVFGALPAAGVFLLEDDGPQAAEFVAVFVTEFVEASVGLSVELRCMACSNLSPLAVMWVIACRWSSPPRVWRTRPQACRRSISRVMSGARSCVAPPRKGGCPFGMNAPEDSQNVVLRARQVMLDLVHHVVSELAATARLRTVSCWGFAKWACFSRRLRTWVIVSVIARIVTLAV
jgi:hypothetical protein